MTDFLKATAVVKRYGGIVALGQEKPETEKLRKD